jgi:hypothetical protein
MRRKCAGHAGWLSHDQHEEVAVPSFLAERRVHVPAGMPERPLRRCRETLHLGVLLPDEERFQNSGRFPVEQVRPRKLEQLVADAEALIDRHRRGIGRGEETDPQIRQHDARQLQHCLRGAIEALHELFAGSPRHGFLHAHAFGNTSLQIEQQAVLAAPDEMVQLDPERLQHGFVAGEAGGFGHRENAVDGEVAPRSAHAARACDPQDDLKVAEAARVLLEVRLEAVRDVIEPRMPLVLFEQLGFAEGARVQGLLVGSAEPIEQERVSGEQPRFEEIRLDRDVLLRLEDALGDRACALADLQPEIPQRPDELFDRRLLGVDCAVTQENQEVHIGVRKQLTAPVASHRDERRALRHQSAPRFAQQSVHEVGHA